MYKKEVYGLVGCLVTLIAIPLCMAIAFGWFCLLTQLVIWISNGMFNYDLSDKFWYVFAILFVLNIMLGGKLFSVNVRKG